MDEQELVLDRVDLATRLAPDRAAARTALGLPADGEVVAVLPGSTSGEVTGRVEDILQAAGVNGATVQILNEAGQSMSPENAGFGDVIDVTVSVPFNQVSWLPTSRYFAGKSLTASTIMRGERVQ